MRASCSCAAALIFWLGAQAPNEDGVPPAYQSVLLVTGLPLLYGGLLTAADVLGADFDDFPAGALIVGLAAGRRRSRCGRRSSATARSSLLLAAILGGVALLSAWSWIFDAASATPYRWLLAAYAAALVLPRWRCASRRAATPRC